MAHESATPLQQAIRRMLVADLAMKRATGPDEWFLAFDDWWTANLWREEIEAKKRRPLAEDFFYKPYPREPKPRETRSAHQQRKAEVQSLQSLIEQRTQLGDIDHGPLPRAPPRCGNSVPKALRMRLGMKEERLTRDKKGDL